jgi:cytochrome bd-type quinol oxidase subunit 2
MNGEHAEWEILYKLYKKYKLKQMKTLTTTQKSIMIFVTIIGYHFLISEIRNQLTNPKYILWINIASLVILVAAVLLSLHLKEKSENKPNYKIYFYYTFFIFLLLTVSLLLRN